jgi:hypothetical protein
MVVWKLRKPWIHNTSRLHYSRLPTEQPFLDFRRVNTASVWLLQCYGENAIHHQGLDAYQLI